MRRFMNRKAVAIGAALLAGIAIAAGDPPLVFDRPVSILGTDSKPVTRFDQNGDGKIGKNLTVGGSLTVNNTDVIAELDRLRKKIDGLTPPPQQGLKIGDAILIIAPQGKAKQGDLIVPPKGAIHIHDPKVFVTHVWWCPVDHLLNAKFAHWGAIHVDADNNGKIRLLLSCLDTAEPLKIRVVYAYK